MSLSVVTYDPQRPLRGALRDLARSRELLLNLIWKDLRVRYRYAAMGFLWAVLEPLLMTLILTFVFSLVFRYRPGAEALAPEMPFALFLLCGLIFWQFTAQSVGQGTKSLINNRNLVGKVAFPREVIPYATIGVCAFNLAIGFVILMGLITVFGGAPGWTWLLVPLVFMAQLALVAGLALLLSTLNVGFRDVEYITDVALVFGFYATPIFYAPGLVRELAAEYDRVPMLYELYMLNPMACLVTAYRDLLLNNQAPVLFHVAWPAALGAAALITGLWVFRRNAGTLADRL